MASMFYKEKNFFFKLLCQVFLFQIIKQCQVILNFLAAEGRLSTQHIDCIWAAAQVTLTGHVYLFFYSVLFTLYI